MYPKEVGRCKPFLRSKNTETNRRGGMYKCRHAVIPSRLFLESAYTETVGFTVSKHSKRITFCEKIRGFAVGFPLFFYACWGNPRPQKTKTQEQKPTTKHTRRINILRLFLWKGANRKMQNRTRKEQLIVRVTPEEKKLIQKKMKQYRTDNFSRYARKMLIDGYVLHLDLTEFQKLSSEINAIGVNINQITKTVNSTRSIYGNDMIQLRELVNEVWRLQKSFLSELLSKIQ